jgi:hypothetical protein
VYAMIISSKIPIFLITLLMAVFMFEFLPAALSVYFSRAREWQERKAFSEHEQHLLSKYPTFVGRYFEESILYVEAGRLLPGILHAYHSNSIADGLRRFIAWVSNNFLLRMLSPTTPTEYIGLLIVISITIYFACNSYVMLKLRKTMSKNHQYKKKRQRGLEDIVVVGAKTVD